MLKLYTFIALLTISISGISQSVIHNIPANSPVVIRIKSSAIMPTLKEQGLVDKLDAYRLPKWMIDAFVSPNQFGLSDGEIWSFMQDKKFYPSFILKITDESVFKTAMLNRLEVENGDHKFIDKNGSSFNQQQKWMITINNGLVWFTSSRSGSYYRNTYDYNRRITDLLNEIDNGTYKKQHPYGNDNIIIMEEPVVEELEIDVPSPPSPPVLMETEIEIEEVEMEDYPEEYTDYYEGDAVEEAVEVIDSDEDYRRRKPQYELMPKYKNHPAIIQFTRDYNAEEEIKKKEFYDNQRIQNVDAALDLINFNTKAEILDFSQLESKFNDKNDVQVYFRYTAEMFDIPGYSRRRYNRGLEENGPDKLTQFLTSSHSFMSANFEKGNVILDFEQQQGNQFGDYKFINNSPIEKKTRKMMPKEPLAYTSFNYNNDQFYDFYVKMMTEVAEVQGRRHGKKMAAAVELANLFIDKDVVQNSFSGSGFIAVTGEMDFISTKRSYEYDSTTFDYHYVNKLDTSKIPEYTAVLKLGKNDYVMRMLNMAVKADFLQLTESGVYLPKANGIPVEKMVLIKVINGHLCISNNMSLLSQYNKGLTRKERITSNKKELINVTGNALYWDGNAIIGMLSKYAATMQPGMADKISNLNEMTGKGYITVNQSSSTSSSARAVITMKEGENSWVTLMKMVAMMTKE